MNINELQEIIEKYTTEELITKGLSAFYQNSTVEYDTLLKWYSEEEFNELHNNIDYFIESIQDIKQNWQHYERVYEMLSDEVSKKTYLGMLYAKVLMDPHYIEDVYSESMPYFSEQIWGKLGNETYLDCGAYTGDTVLKFINVCPWYKHISAFEALPEIATVCCKQLSDLMVENQIEVLSYAVSDVNKTLRFAAENKAGDSHMDDDGEEVVKAVALDDVIEYPVTFIKMDIEGSEKEALIGAKTIIQKYTPKMAICIYHLKDDFWKIPELVRSINKNYDFAVRQHDCEVYAETVLYCIPKVNLTNSLSIDTTIAFHRLQIASKKLIVLDSGEARNFIDHVKAKKWFLSQIRSYRKQYERGQRDISDLKSWISDLEKGKQWLEEHSAEQERYIQLLLKK